MNIIIYYKTTLVSFYFSLKIFLNIYIGIDSHKIWFALFYEIMLLLSIHREKKIACYWVSISGQCLTVVEYFSL